MRVAGGVVTGVDIPALLGALDGGGISYVLIGATALAAHGPIRATEDIDVVPDPDPENLRRLGNLLVSLDARMAADPDRALGPEERAALAQGRNLTVETAIGGLDVVQRLPGVPSYAELSAEAVEMELFGLPVAVCSRRHLRAMKLARGSHRDLADLEDLDATEG
jgi:hypothetical protein